MRYSPITLEQVRIASPCTASWERMEGNDRVRHCAMCDKNVYNLSGMSRVQAETLVTRLEGKLCVRFYRRADGTMLTGDCRIGAAGLRRPWLLVGGLAAAFLVATLGLLTAGTFVLPRLVPHGRALNPLQFVIDWIFPTTTTVAGGMVPPPAVVPPVPPAPGAANGQN